MDSVDFDFDAHLDYYIVDKHYLAFIVSILALLLGTAYWALFYLLPSTSYDVPAPPAGKDVQEKRVKSPTKDAKIKPTKDAKMMDPTKDAKIASSKDAKMASPKEAKMTPTENAKVLSTKKYTRIDPKLPVYGPKKPRFHYKMSQEDIELDILKDNLELEADDIRRLQKFRKDLELDDRDIEELKKASKLNKNDPSEVKKYVTRLRSKTHRTKLSKREKAKEEEVKREQVSKIHGLLEEEVKRKQMAEMHGLLQGGNFSFNGGESLSKSFEDQLSMYVDQ